MGAAKIVRVHNPLSKALHGHNRIDRKSAIEQAERCVKEVRDDLTVGLKNEIDKIDALTTASMRHLPADAPESGIALAAVIFNLAGVLGYPYLQAVAASLHDVLVVMMEKGLLCADPVIVHAQASRLTAPGMPPISEEEARRLLDHLGTIVAHFRDRQNPCGRACSVCPGAADTAS